MACQVLLPSPPHAMAGRRDDDVACMRQALQLGEQGRATAAPNPWVGCLLVHDDQVVGAGFHRRAGEPHAETWAIAMAGAHARGATAYVTLEPCSHYGRTPPCTEALIAAGVARVVVALVDPDLRVSGRGVERLRQAGIDVEVGLCAAEAAASLAPYLHHRRTGRAYCLLKAAVTLDGRTAAADGSARWITGPAARADSHTLRAASQAIVVGAGTALIDGPTLTVRDAQPLPDRQPLRVLLDARGRVPARGPLFDLTLAPTLVITTPAVDQRAKAAWCAAGAQVASVPAAAQGGVDLVAALEVLGQRGVLQALVEGGPTLSGALVQANLVDRLVVYVGAKTLGEAGRPLLAGPGPSSMADATPWRLVELRQVGSDARLDLEPLRLPQVEAEAGVS